MLWTLAGDNIYALLYLRSQLLLWTNTGNSCILKWKPSLISDPSSGNTRRYSNLLNNVAIVFFNSIKATCPRSVLSKLLIEKTHISPNAGPRPITKSQKCLLKLHLLLSLPPLRHKLQRITPPNSRVSMCCISRRTQHSPFFKELFADFHPTFRNDSRKAHRDSCSQTESFVYNSIHIWQVFTLSPLRYKVSRQWWWKSC